MGKVSNEKPISNCSDDSQRRADNVAEAQRVRESIRAGYRDAIAGRTVEFQGDLVGLLRKHRS